MELPTISNYNQTTENSMGTKSKNKASIDDYYLIVEKLSKTCLLCGSSQSDIFIQRGKLFRSRSEFPLCLCRIRPRSVSGLNCRSWVKMSTKYLKAKNQNSANSNKNLCALNTSWISSFVKIIFYFGWYFKITYVFIVPYGQWLKLQIKWLSLKFLCFTWFYLKFPSPTILRNQVTHEVSFS